MYYLAQQEYITQLLHNCHIFATAKPFENKDRCSPGIRTHVALQSLYIREKRYYCVRISCDENTNHSQYSCEIESDLRRSHDNNCETLVFNVLRPSRERTRY